MANPNRRNGRSESQAVGAPKWVVFVGGLATGVIATVVTGALLWPRTLAPASEGAEDAHAAATAADANKANDSIHYEYDDMLRTSEVPVEAPASAETADPADAAPARVVLQAGSFRNRDDAENMRAQLLLLGIGPSSTREALVKGGEVWHRVLVGPFANEAALRAAQAKLQRQNIEALAIAAPADMRVEAPVQAGAVRAEAARPIVTPPAATQPAVTRAAVAQAADARTDVAPTEGAGAARPMNAPKPVTRPSLPPATAPEREPSVREQPPRPLPVEAATAGAVSNHSASNRTTGSAVRAYPSIDEACSAGAVTGVA